VLEDGTIKGNSGPQYDKTAKVLQVLRRDIMGPEVFDKTFRTYIKRWAYKHPTPMDFFRTMADGYGHNLDWFWRECFLEAPRFDQSIDSVSQTVQGSDAHVSVTYGNKGRMVMPLLVRFTFSDGTTQNVTYAADVWRANPAAYTVSYTFPKKTVSQIVLDPNKHLPDADRSNNTWMSK
jgi:aminopeptidase N